MKKTAIALDPILIFFIASLLHTTLFILLFF